MRCIFDLPDELCAKASDAAKELSISSEAWLAKAIADTLERDGKHESPTMLINKLTFHRLMDGYAADVDLQKALLMDLRSQVRDVYTAWREKQITNAEFFSEVEALTGIRKPSPAWAACPERAACPCPERPCAAMVAAPKLAPKVPEGSGECGDGCRCGRG